MVHKWSQRIQNRDRDALLGSYAKPRPRRLTGNLYKTETETPYWELIQNRDRDGRWWRTTGPPVPASHFYCIRTPLGKAYWGKKRTCSAAQLQA